MARRLRKTRFRHTSGKHKKVKINRTQKGSTLGGRGSYSRKDNINQHHQGGSHGLFDLIDTGGYTESVKYFGKFYNDYCGIPQEPYAIDFNEDHPLGIEIGCKNSCHANCMGGYIPNECIYNEWNQYFSEIYFETNEINGQNVSCEFDWSGDPSAAQESCIDWCHNSCGGCQPLEIDCGFPHGADWVSEAYCQCWCPSVMPELLEIGDPCMVQSYLQMSEVEGWPGIYDYQCNCQCGTLSQGAPQGAT